MKKSTDKFYWRSINQLKNNKEFKSFVEQEFPENAWQLNDSFSRRKFITLMGASLALAGLTYCRRPVEKILPYSKAPENVIPGVDQYYATSMPFNHHAYGIVAKSTEGRPIKIEGNPNHPSTPDGASNLFMQASILDLYDPDRSKTVIQNKSQKKWADFVTFWQNLYTDYINKNGEGLTVLSESFSSPTLYRLYTMFFDRFPKAKWFVCDSISDESIHSGIEMATGQTYIPLYHFDKASLILSLDADFLANESENIKYANDFSKGRDSESFVHGMNRLYMVESSPSITGGTADHRFRLPSALIGTFAAGLAIELSKLGVNIPDINPLFVRKDLDFHFIQKLAKDLVRKRGKGLILAGRNQPPQVHSLVYAINFALNNIGHSIHYQKPRDCVLPRFSDLKELERSVENQNTETLFILGGNPVYNSPADLDFASLLSRIDHTMHLSSHYDETSGKVEWHIPQNHFLESWGDVRAIDGTASIIQPLISPLYEGKSLTHVVDLLVSGRDKSTYEKVRETWKMLLKSTDFDREWENILHLGVFAEDNKSLLSPELDVESFSMNVAEFKINTQRPNINQPEINFIPSPKLFDGRFANNGWLQELPYTISKLTWDNAAMTSPQTARELGLENEDVILITHNERKVKLPVWIVPGHADYSFSLFLGYGRKNAGQIGNNVGTDVFPLRTLSGLNTILGVQFSKTQEKYTLASVQDHASLDGRPLLLETTLDEYSQHPDFVDEKLKHPPLRSLWREHSYETGYQWGMVIDLNRCIGCNTCTIACQSENNIPIVGKTQVKKGREMHWIRVDRYFEGDIDNPGMAFQPIPCMHCENAPCEQVCPVAATSHDGEGLNVMTYNRCIGTRYCSNNCPYKVRRFNFFNYTDNLSDTIKMSQNPNVTIRSRGVMEKCTYCLQRINTARMEAKRENRTVGANEIQTACQQACPTNAIQFGDINNKNSKVWKLKKNNRNYHMLVEYNIKPRTSYLIKIRNPNSELKKQT